MKFYEFCKLLNSSKYSNSCNVEHSKHYSNFFEIIRSKKVASNSCELFYQEGIRRILSLRRSRSVSLNTYIFRYVGRLWDSWRDVERWEDMWIDFVVFFTFLQFSKFFKYVWISLAWAWACASALARAPALPLALAYPLEFFQALIQRSEIPWILNLFKLFELLQSCLTHVQHYVNFFQTW